AARKEVVDGRNKSGHDAKSFPSPRARGVEETKNKAPERFLSPVPEMMGRLSQGRRLLLRVRRPPDLKMHRREWRQRTKTRRKLRAD
ncbi:MAG: hypothetical protein WD073_06305, partial [Xanthobacteraceae bacterium]